MSIDKTYKEKLQILQNWMPMILSQVKKDLRNEHLKNDFAFVKKYFPGKNIHKIEMDELVAAYTKALASEENSEKIAEFIGHRWIFRNSEMYHFFEQFLLSHYSDFTEIKELTDAQATALIEKSGKEFGYPKTYIFALFNAVAFSPAQLKKLAEIAKTSHAEEEAQSKIANETKSWDDMKNRYEQEIQRLSDRYEKKLLGMQKKYVADVEMLKKQVSTLQRKLAGV